MKQHKIAAILGDGIGKKIMPEEWRVMNAACTFGIELDCMHIEWASCDYYAQHAVLG